MMLSRDLSALPSRLVPLNQCVLLQVSRRMWITLGVNVSALILKVLIRSMI